MIHLLYAWKSLALNCRPQLMQNFEKNSQQVGMGRGGGVEQPFNAMQQCMINRFYLKKYWNKFLIFSNIESNLYLVLNDEASL